MKKALIIFLSILCIAVIIVLGILVFTPVNSEPELTEEQIKTCNYLNDLTYDIVEESYLNYGDISKSIYSDIVSEQNYNNMCYIRETGYNDRNKFRIYISTHSVPQTTLTSENTAKTIYTYESKYDIIGTDRNNVYGKSECTVEWQLKDDGKWHVVDFIDPP